MSRCDDVFLGASRAVSLLGGIVYDIDWCRRRLVIRCLSPDRRGRAGYQYGPRYASVQ